MAKTFDINTGDTTIDGTPPGQTFRPLRYTETFLDEVRVGVWLLLSTWLGTSRLATNEGLDYESIQNPSTSDAEISELTAELVLGYPGVTAITRGPDVVRLEQGSVASITMTVEASEESFELTFPVA